MLLPVSISGNIRVALSALAAILAVAGLLFCGVSYFSVFLFLQNVEGMVIPQIDVAIEAAGNAQAAVVPAADSAETATSAIVSLSNALAEYSSVSSNLSDAVSAIASLPLLSSDARFSSTAKSLKAASGSFANASLSLNSTAASASSASAAIRKISDDIGDAKLKLGEARSLFKSAIGALHLAALAGFAALALLFSSVLLLAASNLAERFLPKGADSNKKKEER